MNIHPSPWRRGGFSTRASRIRGWPTRRERQTSPRMRTNCSTAAAFPHRLFQKKLREMDVRRFERDLLPYGEPDTTSTDGLGRSVYFPFGYVSTGRVCWVASFKASAGRKFSPPDACHGPCNGLLLEMGGAQSNFRLFEGGNTVFYLYPPSVLGSFATDPTYKEVRLVCQGLAI